MRLLETGLKLHDIEPIKKNLADGLSRSIPAGVGSVGRLQLDDAAMDAMLEGGARWAVEQGHGSAEDLERIEEHGCMALEIAVSVARTLLLAEATLVEIPEKRREPPLPPEVE